MILNTSKFKKLSKEIKFAIIILCVAIIYSLFYFNYLKTPTMDYMSNFKNTINLYLNKDISAIQIKIMPVYPFILALLSKLQLFPTVHDNTYMTAITFNILLFIPFLIITYKIYSKFIDGYKLLIAYFFLCINTYIVYGAINAELEMFYSCLIVSTFYLTLQGSKWGYAGAFFTAGIKWDSVFIIPSVMFKDFFMRKKKFFALFMGVLASSITLFWFILSILQGNEYVQEVSKHGPNIYRFFIDCYLSVSGFVAWLGTYWWFSESLLIKILLVPILAIYSLFIIVSVSWGCFKLLKDKKPNIIPIYIFFAGYTLIHVVYQNSKTRYVIPILWLLNLCLFYGLFEGILPWIQKKLAKIKKNNLQLLKILLLVVTLISFSSSIFILFTETVLYLKIFSISITGLFLYMVTKYDIVKKRFNIVIMTLICWSIINFMISFGKQTMDHYSYRRVEFLNASTWFMNNSTLNEKMIISVIRIPKYYFGEQKALKKFYSSGNLKSKNLKQLIVELKKLKINYIYTDYFYRVRYLAGDHNALVRKPDLYIDLIQHGEDTGYFKIIKEFKLKSGHKSFIFKFDPKKFTE